MSKTQGPHHAPDEPKSRALALAGLGHSYESIAPWVGVSAVTVGRWVARSREVKGNKPILDEWTRCSLQALDLIGDGLDCIEKDDTGALALKNLHQLVVVAGTGTDKLQKESAPDQATSIQINFVFKDSPDG